MADLYGEGESIKMTSLVSTKIPAGGGRNWELSNDDAVRSITGVIAHRQIRRVWWEKKRSGSDKEAQRPDCSSTGGGTGKASEQMVKKYGVGGRCAKCPMNEWETAVRDDGSKGKGKACQQRTNLFVLRPGFAMPLMVKLAPSNFDIVRDFTLARIDEGLFEPFSYVTDLSLETQENDYGDTYSTIVPRLMSRLSDEDTVKAGKAAEFWIPMIESWGMATEDEQSGAA